MAKRFHYSGDINAVHGGYFYNLSEWHNGYADAVRITPASDAGGPDNVFWVETLTVNIERSDDDIERALQCIGQTLADLKAVSPATRKHILIDAHIAYGHFDICETETVQVGPKDEFAGRAADEYRITVNLRAGSDIGRYARKLCSEL